MRYWTVEEARAYLPRLRVLVGVIRRATRLAAAATGNGHASLPGSPPGARTAQDAVDPPQEAPVAGLDADQAREELERHGIELRDPEQGLIDFRARHAGRDVYLCWRLGEEDLGWWHLPEDGFAGRRPLPLPPEP